MAYNKAKEERRWRIWKQAEEKMLRELGVSEDKITKLREHDWAVFNSDRRYYQRLWRAGTYIDEVAAEEFEIEINTIDAFLDSIADERLHQELITVDKLTLQALMFKLQGFTVSEISVLLGLNEQIIYKRLNRFKNKIKKLLG